MRRSSEMTDHKKCCNGGGGGDGGGGGGSCGSGETRLVAAGKRMARTLRCREVSQTVKLVRWRPDGR